MPKFYTKKTDPVLNYGPDPDHHLAENEDPLKVWLTWVAPARPYRKKDRSFYTTTAIIVTLLCLIALLAHEFLLIGAILAFVFVVYVLNFSPPEDVHYKISTQGVTIGEHFYSWGELESFWFTHKEGQKILNVLTNIRFPSQLIIPMGEESEEKLRSILSRYLLFYEVAPKSFIDDWAEKLQKHFPLENPHK